MVLFDIPDKKPQETVQHKKPKLKKGETINDLINQSRKLVEEKLKEYKDKTTTFTTAEQIENFFKEAEEGSGVIGIDTETTRSIGCIIVNIMKTRLTNNKLGVKYKNILLTVQKQETVL